MTIAVDLGRKATKQTNKQNKITLMAHYGLPRTQRFFFRRKTLMAHCGLQRIQHFLFQAENFDGALWIAKDPTFLISGRKL